jgi:signal peptidase I
MLRAVSWLPVGFAFSELVAALHSVSGISMQPTLNPSADVMKDVIAVEKISVR